MPERPQLAEHAAEHTAAHPVAHPVAHPAENPAKNVFDPAPPELLGCERCPRLVAHREQVAREKRRAYRDAVYWGRPVPGFGDPQAPILLLGLAPGAHGSNRTGRMFTGDGSGNFLYPALYRAGLANQPDSSAQNDGLGLRGVFITAAARCAPPGNKPSRDELANCQGWLERDIAGLPHLRVVLALGGVAHDSYLGFLQRQGRTLPHTIAPTLTKAAYPFAHGALHRFAGALPLLDSYHVSLQNTNTGRLTPAMFDAVLAQAKSLAADPEA